MPDQDAGGARYAVYFAPPPDSFLHLLGSAWLGRDAVTGAILPQVAVPGLAPERVRELTAAPRHYGFHATLKPPFELAEGVSRTELRRALEEFVRHVTPFGAPPLKLTKLDGFLALTPSAPSQALDQLAAECVTAFDRFRKPLNQSELMRRRKPSLTPRQARLLETWGYPYVLDDFRFHMTLTSRVEHPESEILAERLRRIMTQACREDLFIDAICLFRQADRQSPFHVAEAFPFAGATRDRWQVLPHLQASTVA